MCIPGDSVKTALNSAVACRLVAATTVLLLFTPLPTYAEDPPQYGWREVWAGADASSNVWHFYSGGSVAPFSHMFDDGLRLRFAGDYGGYTYEGYRRAGHKAELASFKCRMTFTDVLVGYLKRFGPLTAKGFVGASAIRHDINPLEPRNPVQGLNSGPKVVLELWLSMGSDTWSSVDLNSTSAHQTYAARVRTGYRVLDDVSVGLEARIDGNALDKDARGGAFVRREWQGGEISIAGGIAGQFFEDAMRMTTPYATTTWLMQYWVSLLNFRDAVHSKTGDRCLSGPQGAVHCFAGILSPSER